MSLHGYGERIVAAADRYEGKTFSMLPPSRHGEVLHLLYSVYGEDYIGKEEQGFITNFHRFVERTEAKRIAKDADQLTPRASKLDELFSEDLW